MKFYLWLATGITLAIAMSGCATFNKVIADEAAKCGPGLVSAVLETKSILETATSADAALASIQGILQAAGADISAVWCVVQVAIDDLKTQPQSAPVVTSNAKGQLRPFMTYYPLDPVAHGIAVGTDVLKMKPAK